MTMQSPPKSRPSTTIRVWKSDGSTERSQLLEGEPTDVELTIADTDFGEDWELARDQKVLLSDDVQYHGTYAILVPEEDRPLTVNLQPNDSAEDRVDWDGPVQGGITFKDGHQTEPFQTELRGRVLLWAERPTKPTES